MRLHNETNYDIRILQRKIIGNLEAIDKICREHGLHYYLWAGTMLGANPAELNNLQKHSVMVRTNSMFQPETVHVEVSDEVLHLKPLSDEEVKGISMAHAMNLGDAPST